MSCEFSGIINQVATDGDADTVRVFFLGTVVVDDAGISHSAVFWDILDSVVCHEENGVGASSASFVIALGEASKFLSKCCSPNFTHDGVIH